MAGISEGELIPRKVMITSPHGTFNGGIFISKSDDEAIGKAQERYNSAMAGKEMVKVGKFEFAVVDRGEHCTLS